MSMASDTLYTLEGVESDYSSIGLGVQTGKVIAPPTAGERFVLWDAEREGHYVLRTSKVRHARQLANGVWGFATEHTTYTLKPVGW